MRYFVEHPHAVDSLEGVARWRLLQQRVDEIVADTESALDWLVNRGLVQRIDVTSGPPLFCVVEEKVCDVERLLAEEAS